MLRVAELEALQPNGVGNDWNAEPKTMAASGLEGDEQAQRDDHGVELRPALDRPDDDPLDDGAEDEAGDQRGDEARASRSGRR